MSAQKAVRLHLAVRVHCGGPAWPTATCTETLAELHQAEANKQGHNGGSAEAPPIVLILKTSHFFEAAAIGPHAVRSVQRIFQALLTLCQALANYAVCVAC